MAEMMTVKQASERWGIFDSRITKELQNFVAKEKFPARSRKVNRG